MVPLAKMEICHGDSLPTCNISNESLWIQPLSWEEKHGIHYPDYCLAEGMSYYQGEVEGVEVVSFDQAMEMEGWIIGGGQIYKLFLPYVNQLHRTIIDTRVDGADTHFPDITGMGFKLNEEKHVPAGEKTNTTWYSSIGLGNNVHLLEAK